ncbi:hypothetical protein MIND_00525500 [Mycena indigotica]|uniref:MIT domain-containing protein n=1 Tax=Mycena indigotica TaxID=2126181 RepID=A0A8H6T0N6_9AGAR|nr:uncharacterized protein MIND_00525500 [Mycena indigotica]KAF7307315.1 hypothetical protein MIND_00525500 [Mycena indigotica]
MAYIPAESLDQTITRALAAAQVAVNLDAADQDAMAIALAYQRCISLLDEAVRRNPTERDWVDPVRSKYQERVKVLLLSRTVIAEEDEQEQDRGKARGLGLNYVRKARRWTIGRMRAL